ncbi:MAG: hypothetical protein QME87_08430 [Bacillota bacterium]|nr:hypothetical protein [Bacillota bacterium]
MTYTAALSRPIISYPCTEYSGNSHRVQTITGHALLKFTGDDVVLVGRDFQTRRVVVDTVVLSVGLRPERGLCDALAGKVPNLYLTGDAREARNVTYSIWDAYEVARAI